MNNFDRIAEQLNEGVNDPGIFKAVFVVGPPGTGKTTIAKKVTANMGLRYISSDEVFEFLMKGEDLDMDKMGADDYSDTQEIRKVARRIMYRKKDNAIAGRLGLLIDTPGYGDYVLKDKMGLELRGYDCYMIFVQAKLGTALQRNASRSRKVPEDRVAELYSSVMKNRDRYRAEFGADRFQLVITDKEVNTDEVWKAVKKFVDEPISNPIAKKWIKAQEDALKPKKEKNGAKKNEEPKEGDDARKSKGRMHRSWHPTLW